MKKRNKKVKDDRDHTLNKMVKWDGFRDRRIKAIDKYIYVRERIHKTNFYAIIANSN